MNERFKTALLIGVALACGYALGVMHASLHFRELLSRQ